MRAVAPDRRPPPAAWGFAGIALLPLLLGFMGYRLGWTAPMRELAEIWALVLLGLFSGVVATSSFLRDRWAAAYLLLIALALAFTGLVLPAAYVMNLAEACSLGFTLVLGVDLWVARAGLMPEWWPRLKLGFTILAVVLLLGPGIV